MCTYIIILCIIMCIHKNIICNVCLHILSLGPKCPYLGRVTMQYSIYMYMYVGDDNSDCPLPDLLSGVPSANTTDISLCNPDEKPSGTCSILFEEGSVTYNGSSSGSIATYNVTDAYCVNTTMQRECVAGMWINEVILERGKQLFMQQKSCLPCLPVLTIILCRAVII